MIIKLGKKGNFFDLEKHCIICGDEIPKSSRKYYKRYWNWSESFLIKNLYEPEENFGVTQIPAFVCCRMECERMYEDIEWEDNLVWALLHNKINPPYEYKPERCKKAVKKMKHWFWIQWNRNKEDWISGAYMFLIITFIFCLFAIVVKIFL